LAKISIDIKESTPNDPKSVSGAIADRGTSQVSDTILLTSVKTSAVEPDAVGVPVTSVLGGGVFGDEVGRNSCNFSGWHRSWFNSHVLLEGYPELGACERVRGKVNAGDIDVAESLAPLQGDTGEV